MNYDICNIHLIEYRQYIIICVAPLEGLLIGTRPGDLDPGVVLFMLSYYIFYNVIHAAPLEGHPGLDPDLDPDVVFNV